MSKSVTTIGNQIAVEDATLRALLDFSPLLLPQCATAATADLLRVHTHDARSGALHTSVWSGAFGGALNLSVNTYLDGTTLLHGNSRAAQTITLCLHDIGRYAHKAHDIETHKLDLERLVEAGKPIFRENWNFSPDLILAGLRALGAPDRTIRSGHFTLPGLFDKHLNPLVLCYAGTVARHPWRMWLMPIVRDYVAPLEFIEAGAR